MTTWLKRTTLDIIGYLNVGPRWYGGTIPVLLDKKASEEILIIPVNICGGILIFTGNVCGRNVCSPYLSNLSVLKLIKGTCGHPRFDNEHFFRVGSKVTILRSEWFLFGSLELDTRHFASNFQISEAHLCPWSAQPLVHDFNCILKICDPVNECSKTGD